MAFSRRLKDNFLFPAGPGGSQEFAVARYNPNGSLDSTFGSGGLALNTLATFQSGDGPAGYGTAWL